MRQAPFMLWITDLSIKDPFFILPIIMGATMFIQQRLKSDSAGPDAGQGDEADANHLHLLLPVVPGWSGAVLGCEQLPVHRSAVVHHA